MSSPTVQLEPHGMSPTVTGSPAPSDTLARSPRVTASPTEVQASVRSKRSGAKALPSPVTSFSIVTGATASATPTLFASLRRTCSALSPLRAVADWAMLFQAMVSPSTVGDCAGVVVVMSATMVPSGLSGWSARWKVNLRPCASSGSGTVQPFSGLAFWPTDFQLLVVQVGVALRSSPHRSGLLLQSTEMELTVPSTLPTKVTCLGIGRHLEPRGLPVMTPASPIAGS